MSKESEYPTFDFVWGACAIILLTCLVGSHGYKIQKLEEKVDKQEQVIEQLQQQIIH